MSIPEPNGALDPTPAEFSNWLEVAVKDAVAKAKNEEAGKPRLLLGIPLGTWLKIGSGILGATLIFLFTWYNRVNVEIRDLPTKKDVGVIIDDELESHSLTPHPPTEERLENLEGEIRIIRESQIRQETIDIQQSEVLQDIKSELKQLRKTR